MKGNNANAFQEYQTPLDFFAALNDEFRFTLDAAAHAGNALCTRFFTPEDDGLEQDWGTARVFCNPPYARWQLFRWVEKAADAAKHGALVVLLIPASVETSWFHRLVWDAATHRPRPFVSVRFLEGRLRFIDPRAKAKSPKGWRPLQSHMLVIFYPQEGALDGLGEDKKPFLVTECAPRTPGERR